MSSPMKSNQTQATDVFWICFLEVGHIFDMWGLESEPFRGLFTATGDMQGWMKSGG